MQHRRGPTEILGDLLKAELAEKTARLIRYQISAARFPVMKSLAEFDFDAAPVNEALVRSLHQGELLDEARNAVVIGGTGTGILPPKICPAAARIEVSEKAKSSKSGIWLPEPPQIPRGGRRRLGPWG